MNLKNVIRSVVVGVLLAAGVAIGIAYHYFSLYVDVVKPNCIAIDSATNHLITYLENHDHKWPRGWDDLRKIHEIWNPPLPDTPDRIFPSIVNHVEIDFQADPAVLAQATPDGKLPPFRVIWLRDGRTDRFVGTEPNRLIWEHLQRKGHRQQRSPESKSDNPFRDVSAE